MNILGKGENAIEIDLLNFDYDNQSENPMKYISIKQITLGNYQPRKPGKITKESLTDLVHSIMEQGILQPIIVRKKDPENYEVIAGERRFLAALDIGLKSVPCFIKDVSEKQAFAIALIENIQREQLTLLEEAESMLRLKEEHFLSVEQVSKIIGKPRTTVANLVRTASLLSREGKILWESGEVDYGHIRASIILEHKYQNLVLQYVVEKRLSVRDTESFIKEKKYLNLDNQIFLDKAAPHYNLSEEDKQILSNRFVNIYKRKVQINSLKSGRIKVSLEFDNLENAFEYLDSNN